MSLPKTTFIMKNDEREKKNKQIIQFFPHSISKRKKERKAQIKRKKSRRRHLFELFVSLLEKRMSILILYEDLSILRVPVRRIKRKLMTVSTSAQNGIRERINTHTHTQSQAKKNGVC